MRQRRPEPDRGHVHGLTTAERRQSTDPSDLNLATIGIAQLAGTQTVTRTVTNVGAAGTYDGRIRSARRASTSSSRRIS